GAAHEGVDAGEERGQRFAGAGGGHDEGVAAGGDFAPAARLSFGGGGEALAEPGGNGGVEGVRGGRLLHHALVVVDVLVLVLVLVLVRVHEPLIDHTAQMFKR